MQDELLLTYNTLRVICQRLEQYPCTNDGLLTIYRIKKDKFVTVDWETAKVTLDTNKDTLSWDFSFYSTMYTNDRLLAVADICRMCIGALKING